MEELLDKVGHLLRPLITLHMADFRFIELDLNKAANLANGSW